MVCFPAQLTLLVNHYVKALLEVIYTYYISNIVNYISASFTNRRVLALANSTCSIAAGRQTEYLTSARGGGVADL